MQAAWVSERDPIIQRYWDSAFLTRWDRILPHVPKHRPRQAEIELYITEACMNHIAAFMPLLTALAIADRGPK